MSGKLQFVMGFTTNTKTGSCAKSNTARVMDFVLVA